MPVSPTSPASGRTASPLEPSAANYSLLTDLYQLTMSACYCGENIADRPASFELFARRFPEGYGYAIAMGLEQALQYLTALRFSSEQVAALKQTGLFDRAPAEFWTRLAEFEFGGTVYALPEGTAFFPNEPIARIDAPLWQAQLVETYLLNAINYQTLIATRAARMRDAAGDRAKLLEFGTRRASSPQAALWAARAALAAGFDATSNVLAALELDRQPSGTMAHALVLAFNAIEQDEQSAFSAFYQYFPGAPLLVDTFDTIAAVRELAENAIDAGAMRIVVALWSDRWDVCVTDNGAGMTSDALARAARPHTTSKIRDRDDLRRIATLGFRGEALYSLACLGELEIRSRAARTSPAEEGSALRFDRNGQPRDRQPAAIAPGTIVTVRDLFAELPGRREALPSLMQQRAWARQAIAKIALCHPGVTWQIVWDDRHWQAIAAGDSAADILAQLSPTIRRNDLAVRRESLALSEPGNSTDSPQTPAIEIALGLPDRCHRRRPDWIYIAVNGRVVTQPDLERSLLRATARTLPRGRYPVCFAHLRSEERRVGKECRSRWSPYH